ncbi:MAG: hypothetical protein M3O46_01060 [Myxococcota bacterium]|nr:hypothetical protein [Myxococcota bacterium]
MTSFKALILPADDPPLHAAVKRQLLFFDSVLLVDPQSDRAILNQGDLAPSVTPYALAGTGPGSALT